MSCDERQSFASIFSDDIVIEAVDAVVCVKFSEKESEMCSF